MSRITMFKREWLKDVKIISGPMSKVELEVTSDVTDKALIRATEPGKSDKYIVNLKAVAKDNYDKLVALFKDVTELPIEQTNGLFLTGSIWHNEGDAKPYLPMKREKILANIDYVENRKGENVLRVVNVGTQPAVQAAAFDYAAAFEGEEEETAGEAIEQTATAGAGRGPRK